MRNLLFLIKLIFKKTQKIGKKRKRKQAHLGTMQIPKERKNDRDPASLSCDSNNKRWRGQNQLKPAYQEFFAPISWLSANTKSSKTMVETGIDTKTHTHTHRIANFHL